MNSSDETSRARRLLMAVVIGVIALNTIIVVVVFLWEPRGSTEQHQTPTENGVVAPLKPAR